MAPIPDGRVLVAKGKSATDAHTGRAPREAWSHAATSQGATSSGREAWDGCFTGAFRGTRAPILTFQLEGRSRSDPSVVKGLGVPTARKGENPNVTQVSPPQQGVLPCSAERGKADERQGGRGREAVPEQKAG